MSEQDNQPQEGMNPEVEVELEETTTEEETVETPEVTEPETVPKSQLQQAVARAKKAEAELKALKEKPSASITKQALSEEDVDLKILISQGMDPALSNDLKIIAKLRGIKVIEAKNDPVFVAMESQKAAEAKAQKAKLGASKGSSQVRKERTINSPGISDTDHKELWKQQNGIN